jgi:DNA-binding XRE family transcriptional regulator
MLKNITIKDVKLKIGEWCKQNQRRYDKTQEYLAQVLEMSRLTI